MTTQTTELGFKLRLDRAALNNPAVRRWGSCHGFICAQCRFFSKPLFANGRCEIREGHADPELSGPHDGRWRACSHFR